MATIETGFGGGGGGGAAAGDESAPASSSSSPRNKVKFLCSYGGKIMPRPPDGLLKYVGGETRVIAVPRDINFADLMKKLSTECEGEMVLKYQVMPEDLDVLVTVKTNEDLKHMLEEYDRLGSEGTPKLRAFLFPSGPAGSENPTSPRDFLPIEQRYIDALNGMARATSHFRLPPINANRPTFSISACSSPKSTSPESNAADPVPQDFSLMNGYRNSRLPMNKVHSSPSLVSLANPQHQSNTLNNHSLYRHHHHHYQHHQQPHLYAHQPPRPSHEPHRMSPSFSAGRCDFGRAPVSAGPIPYNSSRHNMGSGHPHKYGYYEEHSGHRPRGYDRSDSVPHSPR
ncbi:hypothetical protein Tsubulata_025118 [Turnera subulata]|uniref:PB1 domain-containing protein n=1 Tax=Turnera subulata TaxID=218843 RepID=A0A9Q0G3N9_9ROSI|nr:hypothetical protein Tsubulata_025118 [Turnera subulata]